MGLKTDISKLHYNKQAKGIIFSLLKFCSLFYGVGSSLKNKLYGCKLLMPKKVDAYVISVGNLTTGGVGKTPVVAQIANYLTQCGEKVAIVSRGYGGKLKGLNVISDGETIFFNADLAGDEPYWLAENSSAVVITSKNRYECAKFAVDKFRATKIILDDGFQHRKLHRDLDIVLIDSEMGFGNENLLPAGPLREGLEAFDRIDKLVVVSKNTDHTRAEKYAKIMGKKLKKDTVVCYSEPDYAYSILSSGEKVGWDYHPTNDKFIAFSAIGQPKQFYNFLKNFDIEKTIDFDDHHNYTQEDIDQLKTQGNIFITTEKDAGKLLNLDLSGAIFFALKLKTIINVEALLK